jgi:shikimate kinase
MIGRASGHGAVTIVNAIPCGLGAALGIDLSCEAEVRIKEGSNNVKVTLEGEGKGEDTRLAVTTVRSVLQGLGASELGADVTCSSQIPPGVGLKSSSASSNVIALATFAALGKRPTRDAVIQSAVESSRRAGVTVTGALDDASACFYGGVCYTDNTAMRLLKRKRSGHTQVLIYVPKEKRYTRHVDVRALRSLGSSFREVFSLALHGHYLEALTLNGSLTSAALRINLQPALAAISNGALAAGVSGNGPSIVALCRDSTTDQVRSALSNFEGRVLEVRTSNAKARVVSSD